MVIRQIRLRASKPEYKYLVPNGTLQILQDTMEEGVEKYPNGEGWKKPIEYHLDRIVAHIVTYRNGDTSENHLAHIFTRGMMVNTIAGKRDNGEEKP